jgi:hypothetical protein
MGFQTQRCIADGGLGKDLKVRRLIFFVRCRNEGISSSLSKVSFRRPEQLASLKCPSVCVGGIPISICNPRPPVRNCSPR